MASQLRHLKPNIVKFVHAGSRSCGSQVELSRDDGKIGTEHGMCYFYEKSGHPVEMETMLGGLQKLLFGPQEDHTPTSPRSRAGRRSRRTALNKDLTSTSLIRFTGEEARHRDTIEPTREPALVSREVELDSILEKLAAREAVVPSSSPEQVRVFPMAGRSNRMDPMLHMSGEALDNLFGLHTHDSASPENMLTPETLADIESAIMSYTVPSSHQCAQDMLVPNHVSLYSQSDAPNPTLLNTSEGAKQKPSDGQEKRPNLDQLNRIQDEIATTIPRLFDKQMDFRMYTNDVIFENNYPEKPYTIVGLSKYKTHVTMTKILYYLTTWKVGAQALSSTVSEPNSSVTVRWRINRVGFIGYLANLKQKTDNAEWMEGISTFYVNSDGKVTKHLIERVIRDQDYSRTDKRSTLQKLLRIKLAGTAGAI